MSFTKIKTLVAVATFLFSIISAAGQSVWAPVDYEYYFNFERYEIASDTMLHTTVKPYNRSDIASFADYTATCDSFNKPEKFLLDYFRHNNSEHTNVNTQIQKPLFKYFYRNRADAVHVTETNFTLRADPVFQFGLGRETEMDARPFINTRGAEVRGTIDNKIGFYSFISENQVVFSQYENEYINTWQTIPSELFWKVYNKTGYDYFNARGYFTFNPTQHVQMAFGQDRHFIGNGYRSLFLSDFAPSYPFLKINTKIWKLNYTNLFTQFRYNITAGPQSLTPNFEFPKKYGSFHHLSINIGKKLNIGFFESIIYGPEADTLNRGLEIGYLNPIIFYRAIEQGIGSPDNAGLGIDFKWKVFKRFSLYGQLYFDEFFADDLVAQNGSYRNKQALQLGGKYINAFGIPMLDLQGEFNLVRPFTYTHKDNAGSYSHFNQPLAHPLGANFTEIIAIARYQPMARLFLRAKVMYAQLGEDAPNKVWGNNILRGYNERQRDIGYGLGDGVATNIMFLEGTVSYMLWHDLFIDFRQIIRQKTSEILARESNSFYTEFSIRMNLPNRTNMF